MKSSKLENLNNIKSVHFIGIGGSGMFPLAQILHSKGFKITGSDVYESDTFEKVRNLGIHVFAQHQKENITNQDLVVFSAAIKESNPEIQAAKEKNIPIIERSVMLGIIFKNYKNSVGVSGTHGKTTTTSMITSVLIDAEKDPTAIIGGSLSKIGGNSRAGNSDIIVGEACEYVDSFLQLYPKISVITNVDADHLDYFGTLDNVIKSFNKYASQTGSLLIVNGDSANAVKSVENTAARKIFFGTAHSNDYYADNIKFNKKQFADFDIIHKNEATAHISLKVPGKHNVYNALAAFIACLELGVSPEKASKALGDFSGTHRRFEILGEFHGITVADDFAHHPIEIETTLKAASQMGFKKVWAIFQPHTYSRTSMFLNDFAKALSIADTVIVSEILPVRETNTYGIHSKDLVSKTSGAVYIPDFDGICKFVLQNAQEGDLILTLGGGNIYKCANQIADALKNQID